VAALVPAKPNMTAELSTQQIFDQAMRHYQAKEAPQAQSCCRQILLRQPNHGDALQLLGIMESEAGKKDVAAQLLLRAVTAEPRRADFLFNLGICLSDLGQRDQATAALRRAVDLRPNFPEAHNFLGSELQAKNETEAAVECFHRSLALRPNYASALNNLGVAYQNLGRLAEAIATFRKAVAAQPGFVQALANLGGLLAASNNTDEAIPLLAQAVAAQPGLPLSHNNLAIAYREAGRVDDAMNACRRALELDPTSTAAHNNLGNLFKDIAQWPAAMESYRLAIQFDPRQPAWHSNLIAAMSYCGENPAVLRQELDDWNRRYVSPYVKRIPPHENDRSPDRRLKIGYVSADLRNHPVGRFLIPLFAHHDHRNFEIFCYADVHYSDAITDRLRAGCDVWRDIHATEDQKVANQIRQDKIDILVDLSMHTHGNRLLVFARKPAPVQVTYLAYCGSSGLQTMDFRLSDSYLDPVGGDETAYTEQSIRLPSYWCYEPFSETAELNDLPASKNGWITFGCFNNYCKVSPSTWAAWIKILQTLPDSRLILTSPVGSHRERISHELTAAGIAANRVSFAKFVSPKEYFTLYHQIDIALDPFPYCGGTTTCDALWMGVPVVTLKGASAVGRAGVSILSQLKLTEWIAGDVDQYVQIAAKLAGDPSHLAHMRATLRDRMRQSPLMDGAAFARGMEAAYRDMWRRWTQ
jgi:protein O-GlcNAc transferase